MSEVEDLKAVIREAHECIKDLSRLLKESREERGFVDAYLDERFAEKVDEVVTEGLVKYERTLSHEIALAEDAIFKRFEELVKIMLQNPVTVEMVSGDRPSIAEMVAKWQSAS